MHTERSIDTLCRHPITARTWGPVCPECILQLESSVRTRSTWQTNILEWNIWCCIVWRLYHSWKALLGGCVLRLWFNLLGEEGRRRGGNNIAAYSFAFVGITSVDCSTTFFNSKLAFLYEASITNLTQCEQWCGIWARALRCNCTGYYATGPFVYGMLLQIFGIHYTK